MCHKDCDISKPVKDAGRVEKCKLCATPMLRRYSVSITGTRDSFGINKAFVNEDGKLIDNFKTWEREGYRDPKDVKDKRDPDLKEKIKEKQERRKKKIIVGG